MREPDVGPAMQRLLDSMPEQMLRRLKAGEDAAQLEADSIDVSAPSREASQHLVSNFFFATSVCGWGDSAGGASCH